MIQSLNKKIDLTIKATSYLGIASYGKVLVGDVAFEYYNERNVQDFIQIPWTEIEYISASIIFSKYITRFVIFTKKNGHFSFSSRDNKMLLKSMNKYIDSSKMVKSLSFIDVIKKGIRNIFKK